MSPRECFNRDLLSRSICVAACLAEISHEVRLRSVQTGPASLAPERVSNAGSIVNVVRVAPRTTEVKQQDWRLVFVDRPETYRITDCLDELMLGENVGSAVQEYLRICGHVRGQPRGTSAKGPDRIRIGLGEPRTTCC